MKTFLFVVVQNHTTTQLADINVGYAQGDLPAAQSQQQKITRCAGGRHNMPRPLQVGL